MEDDNLGKKRELDENIETSNKKVCSHNDDTTNESSTSGSSKAGLSTSEPSKADLTTSGPSKADLSTSELNEAGPSTSEPSEAGPLTSEPSKAGPLTSESSEAGPSTSEPSEAGPSTSESSEAGPSTSSSDKVERSFADEFYLAGTHYNFKHRNQDSDDSDDDNNYGIDDIDKDDIVYTDVEATIIGESYYYKDDMATIVKLMDQRVHEDAMFVSDLYNDFDDLKEQMSKFDTSE